MLNYHGDAMVVFHELCSTAWSSRVNRTESVLVMGHGRSEAVSATGSDQSETFKPSELGQDHRVLDAQTPPSRRLRMLKVLLTLA